ncbi:MAG TPA: nucleoside recognition domain-containing protein [Syntrophomonadaceae bacterium]|nr:nucleoside recognition domain-containing protein [Syntrophomonadaceae bacterium]
MISYTTFTRGLSNGLKITWELSKAVVPVYILVTILKHTPVLPWLSEHMMPFMHIVGLPGEASLPVVLGIFLNVYAAIGAIASLNLSIKQITVISAIIMVAHSLPVETAVSKKTGIRTAPLVMTRLLVGFGLGFFINVLL